MPIFNRPSLNRESQVMEEDGIFFFHSMSNYEWMGLKFSTSNYDNNIERIDIRWYHQEIGNYYPTRKGVVFTKDEFKLMLEYVPCFNPYEFTSPNNPKTKFTMGIVQDQGWVMVKVEKKFNETSTRVLIHMDAWEYLYRDKNALLNLLRLREEMSDLPITKQAQIARCIIYNYINGTISKYNSNFEKLSKEGIKRYIPSFIQVAKVLTKVFHLNRLFLTLLPQKIPTIVEYFIDIYKDDDIQDKLEDDCHDPIIKKITDFMIHCNIQ